MGRDSAVARQFIRDQSAASLRMSAMAAGSKVGQSRERGLVASLHLHPAKSGEPFSSAEILHLIAGKGVKEDTRYFARASRSTGQPSRRQLSVIEREQISEHAAVLGLLSIPPGVVRSNIETSGIDLQALVGKQVEIGTAIVYFYEPRLPCHKMDAIAPGLCELMKHGRQGVMAEVVRDGLVRVGDAVRVIGSV
jgi:MOSC domain-containing protein YiiM